MVRGGREKKKQKKNRNGFRNALNMFNIPWILGQWWFDLKYESADLMGSLFLYIYKFYKILHQLFEAVINTVSCVEKQELSMFEILQFVVRWHACWIGIIF
jgi:hypothetical protein